ncbi:MAG TPA: biopolymer transporter ExbD [Chitinophagales bacterium]|nr:biopolymer transporter ExbD [Chitinophagales bacterium]
MAKIKVPKSSIAMDMTPMVDMAFLLVTFFILTTKFRPDEPVQVVTPSSTSTITIDSGKIITITVANDGRIFFDLNNQNARKDLIERMGVTYGISFSDDEKAAFATGASIGMHMDKLKSFLDLSPEDRKNFTQPGIAVDTTMGLSNELGYWYMNAHAAAPRAPIVIKGDATTNYLPVKNVIRTLQDRKQLRFGLITSDEAEPTASKLTQ